MSEQEKMSGSGGPEKTSDEVGNSEEKSRFEQFKAWHDEAYLYINQAITQEKPSIDRKDVALMMYQRGLGLLDLALCVDTTGPGPAWDKARAMQTKMSTTRCHVEERIKDLTDLLAPSLPSSAASSTPPARPPPPNTAPPCYDAPPSYDQSQAHTKLAQSVTTNSKTANHPPPSYGASCNIPSVPYLDVDAELLELVDDGDGEVQVVGMRRSVTSDSLTEQGEVLFTMEGVQVFRVSVCGEVSTPSYPNTLYLIKVSREGRDGCGMKRRRMQHDNGGHMQHDNVQFAREENRGGAPAFLEVGQWTYPLVKGKSPVLRSEFSNCYMFPDVHTGIEGDAVGILVPDTVTQPDREIFESLMAELTNAFKTKEDVEASYQEYREFSSNLADGLVRGSEVLGRGMVKGAVKGSELMFHGADYVKKYITPEESAREVDPTLRQGLETAAWVSNGACRVSGWLVGKVGLATMALGRMAAPHLEKGANRALTHLTSQSPHESSNQLKMVGEVASGTVAAVSTMYMALENSSKILAKNIANNTVMIVSHKYGSDMASVTDSALSTAGNSYLTFYNAAALGPKGIAKRAAKDTGKAFIGADQDQINARARVVPDQDLGIQDVLPGDKAGAEKKG